MMKISCAHSVTRISQDSMNILRIICALASILFVMSDTMIAINKFHTPISNSSVSIETTQKGVEFAPIFRRISFDYFLPLIHLLQFWIMTTYYAAQFGFSLSIMDMDTKIKQK